MEEIELERKFKQISNEAPSKGCVIPGCPNPRKKTFYCCDNCNEAWTTVYRDRSYNDFRLWVIEQKVEAVSLYFRLRREDP